MRKVLLCLVLCFSSLCWGQDVEVLGDWSTPVDETEYADISLDKLETTPEQVFAPQETDHKDASSTDDSVIFGVGLNGSDEQQLNFLDGSSLMDYEDVSENVADQESSTFEEELYFDVNIFDQFDEDISPSFVESNDFDEFETFDDLDGFDKTIELEGSEGIEIIGDVEARTPVE